MFENKKKIIEIIGEALSKDDVNGEVAYYGNLGKIALYELAKREDLSKLNVLLLSLLDYLGLEVVPEDKIIIRKKCHK